jgi:5-formyltetrahydrofolate cyclo-ligase
VGVAYHEQLVDEVPHGARDERVHIVMTDREAILGPTDEAFGRGQPIIG